MNISAIMGGIGTLEKIIPVVEQVGKEIGPLVQTELADGKQLWADLTKCFNDFKAAEAATLPDLKTRWAAIAPLPQMTPAQIVTAIQAKINAGTAD